MSSELGKRKNIASTNDNQISSEAGESSSSSKDSRIEQKTSDECSQLSGEASNDGDGDDASIEKYFLSERSQKAFMNVGFAREEVRQLVAKCALYESALHRICKNESIVKLLVEHPQVYMHFHHF